MPRARHALEQSLGVRDDDTTVFFVSGALSKGPTEITMCSYSGCVRSMTDGHLQNVENISTELFWYVHHDHHNAND